MPKDLNLLSVLILLALSSCVGKYLPPKIEQCIVGDKFQCNDIRLPKEEQGYERPIEYNYICTNPADYNQMSLYISKIREKLIRCEADL